MTIFEMAFGLATLLLTPGPTNTLMALAGSERGWRRSAALMPFEVAAYLAVTLPLAMAGGWIDQAAPAIKPVLAALAACWVAWLALSMWRLPAAGAAAQVTARRVVITTLLNPKALVIGLILLPGPDLTLRAAVFAGLICGVAALWTALGACLAQRQDCPARRGAILFRKLAALWLGLLSVILMYSAVHAAII